MFKVFKEVNAIRASMSKLNDNQSQRIRNDEMEDNPE